MFKQCIRCKVEKPLTDFYSRSNRKTKVQSYCKSCNNETRIEQTRRNKVKAVEEFGGSCQRCKYDKCVAALHFHHPSTKMKDDYFRLLRNRKLSYILSELIRQGCELLCANCHAEEHYHSR